MKTAHLARCKVLYTLVSVGDSNALHSTRSLAYTKYSLVRADAQSERF